MARCIGLDVHMQSTTLVVVGPSGKRLHSQVLETNGSTLIQVIRGIPRPRYLCFEEGTQSAWLYELLKPEVDELGVAIADKRQGAKSDEEDAWHWAEQLRVNGVKRRVFKGQGPFADEGRREAYEPEPRSGARRGRRGGMPERPVEPRTEEPVRDRPGAYAAVGRHLAQSN